MTRSSDSIEDEMLVLRVQGGDAAAFEALLRRWLPMMRRHAARLTGDAAAAEDVCQDVCLALVAAMARVHDPARARGWMLRITTHKSADWVRRQQRERQFVRTIQNREPRASPDDSVGAGESHERATVIRRACLHLPPDLRAVVSLFYGEGLPVSAIAEALGAPEGTIKSRLHEARAQLRTLLERNAP